MDYERYAKIRDSVGMKDFDVSKISGIGSSTFSDWKHGRSKPKDAKLKKIANALGVSYAYLMGWESVSNNPSTMALEQIIQTNEEKGGSATFAQFLYDTTVKPAATSNDITDEEFELIKQFRNADDSVKDMIVQLLAYAKKMDEKKGD